MRLRAQDSVESATSNEPVVQEQSLRTKLRSIYRKLWLVPRMRRKYGRMPIAEAFQQVYATGMWDPSSTAAFDSGRGSGGAAAENYTALVLDFIRAQQIKSITDLGCGDFRIGARLAPSVDRYTGVDIVPELIDYHQSHSSNDRVQFACRNLLTDALPPADLCLLRQVLQHLSNEEIETALGRVSQYKFVLISEHVPTRPRSYNADKPHGPDVRAFYDSGVYPDKPPFSRAVSRVWETPLEPGAQLRTVLLTN